MNRYFSLRRFIFRILRLVKLLIGIYALYSSLHGLSITSKFTALDAEERILAAKSSFNGLNTDFAVVRYNRDGTLDTTFTSTNLPTGGYLRTDLAGNNDVANSVVIDTDGKILAAGYSNNGASNEFALIRYNDDGTMDTTFNPGFIVPGIVITRIGAGDSQINAVIHDNNGKYLAGGFSFNNTFDMFTLARYNVNGSLDTTFNPGTLQPGVVTSSLGNGNGIINALTLDSSNRIVAVGSFNENSYALARYLPTGTLDPSFNPSGSTPGTVLTTTPLATIIADSVIIDNNNKIVVAGFAQAIQPVSTFLLIIRYNEDGSIDRTFNVNSPVVPGITVTNIGLQSEISVSVAIDSNNKIILSAYTKNIVTDTTTQISTPVLNILVARYNPDGTLDVTFNPTGSTPGLLDTDISEQLATAIGTIDDTPDDVSNSVLLDPDGNIIVGSFSNNGQNNNDFAIAKYLPTGTLDIAFNVDGLQPGVAFTNVFFDSSFVNTPRGPSPYPMPDSLAPAIAVSPLFKIGTPVVAPIITAPLTGTVLTTITPTIRGKAAPGQLVTIYINNIAVDRVVTDSAGSWEYTLYEMYDNTYTLSALATDVIGNRSLMTDQISFTVSTGIPKPPQIISPSDSMQIGDKFVNILGKSQPHVTVQVFINSKSIGEVLADANGDWSITTAPLRDGAYQLYAKAKAGSGKPSNKSNTITFIINTKTVSAPKIFSPAHNNLVTKQETMVEGTADPNADITIYLNNRVAGKVTSDKLGNWAYQLKKLRNGTYRLHAAAVDKKSKKATKSAQTAFIVDTRKQPLTIQLPSKGTIEIKDKVLSLMGKSDPNSYISISLDGKPMSTVTADNSGTWQYTFIRSPNMMGRHSLSASMKDESGNLKSISAITVIFK